MEYWSLDVISAIIFVLVLLFLIIRYRKALDFQSLVALGKIPLIYIALWRTKYGLAWMDRIAKKQRNLIKLIGYTFIGFAFLGMILITFTIVLTLIQLFLSPREAAAGVSLVLPFVHIPGFGVISFWHFILAIFIAAFCHEMGHGIVARAYNVPVKSSGLALFGLLVPLFPGAFVEPDEKVMKKKSDVARYSILAAGPMVNIILFLLFWALFGLVMQPIGTAITDPVGYSFTSLMEGFPAEEAGLEPGTILIGVNGVETLTFEEFGTVVGSLDPGEEVMLTTTSGDYTLVAQAHPDSPQNGYMGISGIVNERDFKPQYASIGPAYSWTTTLIRWIFLINLFLGLFNLLPVLFMTDGSQILRLALEKTTKKGGQRAWLIVNQVTTFTILAALFLRYIVFGLFAGLF